MRIELAPKQLFQRNDKIKDELGKVVSSDNFHVSLTYALSEFIRMNPTQEEVQGARKFIHILLHLPFEDQPLPEFPTRRLAQSAFETTQPKPK